MKKTANDDGKHAAGPDPLIAEITVDAHGDDEQLWAFLQAFRDDIPVPCDAFVIGEPVSVVAFDYDGNQRRGLVAKCRREGGDEHVVAASEVVLAPQSKGGRFSAAYRKWSGIEPLPEAAVAATGRKRRHKVEAADLDLDQSIELIVLSTKERTARCRLPDSDRIITLRASGVCDIVPGEVAIVTPRKQWSYAGHSYLSGKIQSARLDVAALGLVPLRLKNRGLWTPDEHYWGKEDEPIEVWAKPIIARGPRRAFEMEQILPGRDPIGFGSDPICKSSDLQGAGNDAAALKILMELCQADLRCLDAHAHLGNFAFDRGPMHAIRHYAAGVDIAELSFAPDFEGLLPWGHINNRPFLRCLHGYGLCLWRLSRFQEAERVFTRMLCLNPTDNQGVRFLIDEVRAETAWEDREES